MIHEADAVVARAVRMVATRSSRSMDRYPLEAHTICLHGDTPGAAELARAVRAALEAAGIQIAALTD